MIHPDEEPSMDRGRPVLRPPRSGREWIVEAAALAGLALVVAAFAGAWTDLPQKIPSRIDWRGEPVAWGGKGALWVFPSMSLLIWILLAVLGRFPWVFNYPWEITRENASRQYAMARELLVWIKAETIWLFWFAQDQILRAARGEAGAGGASGGFLGVLALMPLTIAVYFVASYRAR